MSSTTNSVSSKSFSSVYLPDLKSGKINISTGLKHLKPISNREKLVISALFLASVAGLAITGVGFRQELGSKKFFLFVVGGVALTALSLGKILKNIALIGENTQKIARGVQEFADRQPAVCEQAMEFAKSQLDKHKDIKPFVFSNFWTGPEGTDQPVNQDIPLLTAIYRRFYCEFEQELKKYKDNNPWSQPSVIQAASSLMKISYAISRLTLEDLPAFTRRIEESKEKKLTYAEALTKQDSYQYRTYYYCTRAYHWIRGELTWKKEEDEPETLFHPHEISKEHAALFYQGGTVQLEWRMLYNDYCERVRGIVDEESLKKADNRHFNWIRKDEGVKTFYHTPDTFPT
jgi:hypothetical protein